MINSFNKNGLPYSLGSDTIHLKFSRNAAVTKISSSSNPYYRLLLTIIEILLLQSSCR